MRALNNDNTKKRHGKQKKKRQCFFVFEKQQVDLIAVTIHKSLLNGKSETFLNNGMGASVKFQWQWSQYHYAVACGSGCRYCVPGLSHTLPRSGTDLIATRSLLLISNAFLFLFLSKTLLISCQPRFQILCCFLQFVTI